MGNREDLLEGAKRCLFEKGYARTTARDIAGASGVSLAAIGYHFGSKEALLFEALFQAMDEFGQEVAQKLTDIDPDAEPLKRFETGWDRIIELFPKYGNAWMASIEMVAHADAVPNLREKLAEGINEGRLGLAELFSGKADPVLGSFYQALMTGVLVQWLVDPARAPRGADLVKAMLGATQEGRRPARRSSAAG